MKRIKIMINGLPGNVSTTVARHVLNDERFELINHSLTGPEIDQPSIEIYSVTVHLIKPENREQVIGEIKKAEGEFISVDFTHPSAVNGNAEFYCKNQLPFVMGTTGGDRTLLEKTVTQSTVSAVIAPNMAKQIVGFQAMMEYAANVFPGLFNGYEMELVESHQKGKADTSGTAKAMVGYFNQLGIDFSTENIQKIRDPEVQQQVLGVPKKFLSGHGWHTYRLTSADKTVRFEFTHNVNGRDIYAQGTMDAARYLAQKNNKDTKGQVFSMIDVLKLK